ncbi:hypothetical protein GCM10010371_23370 [Streptomyces subrutilus]|uniref:Uncharacterized protein n=1 Tax=Streptomyces subrutilus TaxID=36818 RepID=A0A918QNL2_9ACTN|nr:hypothetical protein GCM10010371_23370 [Streptomyces subrutilus]
MPRTLSAPLTAVPDATAVPDVTAVPDAPDRRVVHQAPPERTVHQRVRTVVFPTVGKTPAKGFSNFQPHRKPHTCDATRSNSGRITLRDRAHRTPPGRSPAAPGSIRIRPEDVRYMRLSGAPERWAL